MFARFFFIFLTLLSLPVFSQQVAPWLGKLKPLNDAVLIVTPDHGDGPIVQAMATAKRSIWIEIYHLTDQNVIQVLLQARSRGVDVRIVWDLATTNTPRTQETIRQLTAAGAVIYPSSPFFTLTHSKTFLIDQNLIS